MSNRPGTTHSGSAANLQEAVIQAAAALLDDLDDAIAGANLESWDAPYRIEAPLFRESADRLREALRPFRSVVDDGF